MPREFLWKPTQPLRSKAKSVPRFVRLRGVRPSAHAAEFSGYVSESSSFCILLKMEGKSWSFRLRLKPAYVHPITPLPCRKTVLISTIGSVPSRDPPWKRRGQLTAGL
jgi:hypothetical protein